MKARPISTWAILAIAALVLLPAYALASSSKVAKADGYLDFRKTNCIIVDGQRITKGPKTKVSGAKSFEAIPVGYAVTVEGARQADGSILASKITAKANGMESYEAEVLAGTNQAESTWVKAGQIVEQGQDGKETSLGALHTTGPEVDRARRIINRLLPSYVDPKNVRIYVVDNKEWNAMAMANFSIYVFSGIEKDLDDDELAIVLGHELTHATHEHSRKQASKGMYQGIAGTVAQLGLSQVHNGVAKSVATTTASLGLTTFGNVYSRSYEDQADRVGLRYVYEAGYNYKKGPALWQKFAAKYGDSNPLENFVFGDHSLSTKRAAALEKEIKNNYSDPKKDPPTHPAS